MISRFCKIYTRILSVFPLRSPLSVSFLTYNYDTYMKYFIYMQEVWTLCRILKRSPCYKKTLPEWRDISTRKSNPVVETGSGDSDYDMQSYISFQTSAINDNKPFANHYRHNHHQHRHETKTNQLIVEQVTKSNVTFEPPSTTASCSSFSGLDVNEFIKHGDWDDLQSVVDQFSVTGPFFM